MRRAMSHFHPAVNLGSSATPQLVLGSVLLRATQGGVLLRLQHSAGHAGAGDSPGAARAPRCWGRVAARLGFDGKVKARVEGLSQRGQRLNLFLGQERGKAVPHQLQACEPGAGCVGQLGRQVELGWRGWRRHGGGGRRGAAVRAVLAAVRLADQAVAHAPPEACWLWRWVGRLRCAGVSALLPSPVLRRHSGRAPLQPAGVGWSATCGRRRAPARCCPAPATDPRQTRRGLCCAVHPAAGALRRCGVPGFVRAG